MRRGRIGSIRSRSGLNLWNLRSGNRWDRSEREKTSRAGLLGQFGLRLEQWTGQCLNFGFDFGGQRRRKAQNGPQRGSDLRVEVQISFKQAVFGTEMEIQVPKDETCDRCNGSGAEPGSSVDTCPVCHGTGQQRIVQNTPFGQMVNVRTCSHCGGTGKIIKKKCTKCHGEGKVKVRKKLKIKIPAGVDDGYRLRISGEGAAGVRGGGYGDLYVYISVRPDPNFVREGDDIFIKTTISFAQAALGSTIRVDSIDGKIELKIPAGTQTGTVFRIRGKGVPVLGAKDRRGDQHVQVNVVVPKRLNAKQKDLLKQFALASGETWVGEPDPAQSSPEGSKTKSKGKESLWSKIKKEL